MKQTWGPLAYVRSAAAALPELHAYRTKVELDDGEKLNLDLYNMIVANGIYVAGGMPVAPEANPGDGFSSAEVDLEDVFFSKIEGLN